MAPIERDAPREPENTLRHKDSASSDHGRQLIIPMWDSSDPERAPPPLPLNPHPQSPVLVSRAGTSSAIQSAHAALSEKARESAYTPTSSSNTTSHALTRRIGDMSPERPLPISRSGSHRRMQSLQTSSVRDRSLLLEAAASSPRSPEKTLRPSTPVRPRDSVAIALERESSSPAPGPGPSLTPIVRPSVRRPPPQSILGENTPPQSATMLALHAMSTSPSKEPDPAPPLSNVTNGAAPSPLTVVKTTPPTFDALSHQIVTLTNIATCLQKDMAQLSRRSRDNATDLLSLKQATNSRDEDIRKSLRELIVNMNDSKTAKLDSSPSLFLDNKPFNTCTSPPTKNGRPFSLPRIPSPNSYPPSSDRDSVSTPSLFYSDAPSTIALLEKVVREMGTKEGQELMMARLAHIAEMLSGMPSGEKIEELMALLDKPTQTVVAVGNGGGDGPERPRSFAFEEPHQNPRELDFEAASPGVVTQRADRFAKPKETHRSPDHDSHASDILTDDILKIIRSVKDSVAQGGGLTAEVKALVRELRGEVLGMGREIRRRLDEVSTKDDDSNYRTAQKEEIARVVNDSLEELKQHMENLLREHRRQSAASEASRASLVDYQEIYNALRAALNDSKALQPPDINREDVVGAVKDAWENYKPDIAVEHFGLERDEVLDCLKEGLQIYAPKDDHPPAATRDEVFTAVVEGLQHFVPPKVETPASLSRDEILDAVRECLEEFEFPVAPSAVGQEITREDVLSAVQEGMSKFDAPMSKALTAMGPSNDEVTERLREIMEFLRLEFRAVSEEAKQNVAANGRDTEQVLDATKDGLEKLRHDMQRYVEDVSGLSAKNDIDGSLNRFRNDISTLLVTQMESLRDSVNMTMVPAPPQQDHKHLLETLREGIDSLRTEMQRPLASTAQMMDVVQEGLSDMRESIERIRNKPTDLTANDEILEALKSGLDAVRSDIEDLREESRDDQVVAKVGDQAMVPADVLKHDDIKNLEVLIAQLRIKVEALEPGMENISRDDVERMESMIQSVKETVEEIRAAEPAPAAEREAPAPGFDAAVRDDIQAVETILRNTKARLDDLVDGEQAVRKEHLDSLEVLITETRGSIDAITRDMDTLSRREDVSMLESLIGHVAASYDEMKERADKELENPEKVTKSDVEAIESVCYEVKALLEQVSKTTDLAALPTKDELKEFVSEMKDRVQALAEANNSAFEERQAETVGVSDRITEVKSFLSEFQDLMKSRLEDGVCGIETVGKLLESMGETIQRNANVNEDLKEMFDTMKVEFEESRAGVVGVKLEADDKFQQTTETLSTKIDDRINELMEKYDDFQSIMDERAKAGELRDAETETAVLGTKAVADELKLLIDTLGSTVTESLEKMEEASKTVFNRVEDLMTKTDENYMDGKVEHEQTRDQIKQAIAAVEDLQGGLSEHQPKILETVKDILLVVGQHYEYSKTSHLDIQEKIEDARPPPPPEVPLLPPVEKYDDTCVQEKLDKLMDHSHSTGKALSQLDILVEHTQEAEKAFSQLDILVDHTEEAEKAFSQLDKLVEHTQTAERAFGQLDALVDHSRIAETAFSQINNSIVDHSQAAERAYVQLESLDKIHQQVLRTAADISDFLAMQTKRINEEQEDRERDLQETTIDLERKIVQRDQVEESIANLREEEARLRESVLGLRTEQEALTRQKTRLTADVSSLQTALHLRREELDDMESRAAGLEKRILEGVMDHSRVLLMAKANKGRDAMSRKRVRVQKPGESVAATTEPSILKPAMNMALTAKRRAIPSNPTNPSRRIVSLGQITSNVPGGGFNRSQSVKAPPGVGRGGMRKMSWGGSLSKKYGDLGKENLALREDDEEFDMTPQRTPQRTRSSTPMSAAPNALVLAKQVPGEEDDVDEVDDHSHTDGASTTGGDVSDTETLRRSSLGTSSRLTTTDADMMSDEEYDDDDDNVSYDDNASDGRSDWTESVVSTTASGSVLSSLSDTTVAGNELVLITE